MAVYAVLAVIKEVLTVRIALLDKASAETRLETDRVALSISKVAYEDSQLRMMHYKMAAEREDEPS